MPEPPKTAWDTSALAIIEHSDAVELHDLARRVVGVNIIAEATSLHEGRWSAVGCINEHAAGMALQTDRILERMGAKLNWSYPPLPDVSRKDLEDQIAYTADMRSKKNAPAG